MTIQKTPYLQAQKNFPRDTTEDLSAEVDIAYIDIAQKINDRIIGQFATGFDSITGEKWFLNGQPMPRQTLRKLFQITTATSYPHGIDTTKIQGFTKIYGVGYDGTNWFPLPYVDATAANNQIQIVVTPTAIVITAGAGTPPSMTSGFVILEWLAVF